MDKAPEIPEFVWQAITAVFMKLIWPAIIGLAIIGGVVLLAWWKGRRLPFVSGTKEIIKERRSPDPIIHELVELVKSNTAAVQAFVSQSADHKSICLSTCKTIDSIGNTLVSMNEQMRVIASDAKSAAAHKRAA